MEQGKCPVNLCLTPTYTEEFLELLEVITKAVKSVEIKKADVDIDELCKEIAIMIAADRGIDIYKR